MKYIINFAFLFLLVFIGSTLFSPYIENNLVLATLVYFAAFLIFSHFHNILVELRDGPVSAKITPQRKKYKLTSLHDALVGEIMILRSDIVDLKAKYLQLDLGLDDLPLGFARLYCLYRSYPFEAACEIYKTKDNSKGGIVLLFHGMDDMDLLHCDFSSEKLRKIRSDKPIYLKVGMSFLAYIYEPDIDKNYTSLLQAKITSIHKGDYMDIVLTLEIDLDYDPSYMDDPWDKQEHIPEIVTRKLNIFNIYAHGIELAEEKKTVFQWINSV